MYAERIRQIRNKLELSVSKLSKKINIPERTIVSYESEGRTPSLDFLSRLCSELDINPAWFLSGRGSMFCSAQNNDDIEKIVYDTMYKILTDKGYIK